VERLARPLNPGTLWALLRTSETPHEWLAIMMSLSEQGDLLNRWRVVLPWPISPN
jgi:hypothetical protein